MLTIKVIHKDNSIDILSFKQLRFVGADGDDFETILECYDDIVEKEDLEDGSISLNVWGFFYDPKCEDQKMNILEFGDKIYVTDMSGKTVFAQEAVLSEPVGNTVN